jgi:outer membrane protein TolC
MRLAKLAFNNTLGREMNQEISLGSESSFSAIDASAVKNDTLLETAYKNRPEWRSFHLLRSIAGENVGIAVGGLLPNVLLIGVAGKNITDYPSYPAYKSDLNSWRAMLTASWTLFDGFSSINKINEARASEAMIKTQEISVRNGIELEVNSAVFDLQAASEKVTAAGIAEDLAKRSLKYAEVNYAAHIGTSLAVLDAEASLHQSQLDLLNAKFDLEIAKAKINKVVGTEILRL